MEFNSFSLNITLIIIIITVIITISGFNNQKVIEKLIFHPPAVSKRNEWYRFITCGFIHADAMHLAFNMYAFYMFGGYVEDAFDHYYRDNGKLMFVILYLSSLVISLLPTYLKNVENYYYRSLGASGAVAAIVFAFIFLAPMQGIGLIFIPGIYIPAFIFGILYLVISAYLDKRGGGNINHSAHFWGSVYGIVFVTITFYFLSDHDPITSFINQVKAWFGSLGR